MPTSPDPNSPFMAGRVEAALGVRAPGGPSMTGKPTPQVGDVSFPAPPGVMSAPPGRPAAPMGPAPAAAAPQGQPVQPKPAALQAGQPTDPVAAAMPTTPNAAALPPVPGASAATPLGVATRGADGQPQLSALTPEGAQRYRELVVQTRAALGPIPRVFRQTGLPEMPVEVGQWNYSPFTGQWSR